MGTKEKTSEEILLKEKLVSQKEIVLYNDDVNTFDHVIETLMTVCKHTPEQAEQCAHLIHFKGKCGVKSGSLKELKPYKDGLIGRGLSAVIE
mgnify:CR=1 FL=1